jgi:hypothetical protein
MLRDAEKAWHKAMGGKKCRLKAEMRTCQKVFDREVQSSKRRYWSSQQAKLEDLCKNNHGDFWKQIGKIGIVNDRHKIIPHEVVLENGEMAYDKHTVLDKWKSSFSSLYNRENGDDKYRNETAIQEVTASGNAMDNEISVSEILNALKKAKKGKAFGIDHLPVEVLGNENCITFLFNLFNQCYTSGVFPSVWKQGIINPIPKSSTSDNRDPLCYRGITLAVSSYKLFCSILNDRLKIWTEDNNLIADEQNGFRNDRNCVDHLNSLVNIVESRLKINQSTFAAFIDFQKAYDGINRNLMWSKLLHQGIASKSKLMTALQGIYSNVKCTVNVNGCHTDWFDVSVGLRQGCILSPLLFNLFINDLVSAIKENTSGIPVADENICVLMYADDLVMLARNERDLQQMLDVLNTWCFQWGMNVNQSKSEIMHFRIPSKSRTNVKFRIGENVTNIVPHYRYLGLVLNEFLDFSFTAGHVAMAASRALGILIAKSKAYGGMPFSSFSKLYKSIVLPVIHYGSAIWGHKQFSCINAIHNKACRYFFGVSKFTANAATQGDTGLTPPIIDQWLSITRQWCRMVNMDNNRISKNIFTWSYQHSMSGCKNGVWRAMDFFNQHNLQYLCNVRENLSKEMALHDVSVSGFNDFLDQWNRALDCDRSLSGKGGNKLRTYRRLKQEFYTEPYVLLIMGKKQRSAMAKFRCGTAPIMLELGRYKGLSTADRLCPFCTEGNYIEDEVHVFTKCTLYVDLRNELYQLINNTDPSFTFLSDIDKTTVILSHTDFSIVKKVARICRLILDRRYIFSNC